MNNSNGVQKAGVLPSLLIIDANAVIRRHLYAENPHWFSEMIAATHNTLSFIVWDGPASNKFRQEIHPKYKQKRKEKPMKTGMKESLQVARDAFSLTSAIQVTVPYYEADDVIVALTRKYQDSYRVTVDTSDRDMWCLSHHRNVSVTCNPIKEVMPRDVQLYKALVGDTSDQIPGVRLFGGKAWESVYRYAEPYAEKLWSLLLANQEDEFFKILMSVHVEPKFLVKIKSDFPNAVMSAHLVDFREVKIFDKHITVGTNDHEALKTLRGRFMI